VFRQNRKEAHEHPHPRALDRSTRETFGGKDAPNCFSSPCDASLCHREGQACWSSVAYRWRAREKVTAINKTGLRSRDVELGCVLGVVPFRYDFLHPSSTPIRAPHQRPSTASSSPALRKIPIRMQRIPVKYIARTFPRCARSRRFPGFVHDHAPNGPVRRGAAGAHREDFVHGPRGSIGPLHRDGDIRIRGRRG
jgi:hypothetical protein